jgi:hypothetical protein
VRREAAIGQVKAVHDALTRAGREHADPEEERLVKVAMAEHDRVKASLLDVETRLWSGAGSVTRRRPTTWRWRAPHRPRAPRPCAGV